MKKITLAPLFVLVLAVTAFAGVIPHPVVPVCDPDVQTCTASTTDPAPSESEGIIETILEFLGLTD